MPVRAVAADELPALAMLMRGRLTTPIALPRACGNTYVLVVSVMADTVAVANLVVNSGPFGPVRLIAFASRFAGDDVQNHLTVLADDVCRSVGRSLAQLEARAA
jgi:hypothetical protein